MAVTFLAMAGIAALDTLAKVTCEALVDTTTDFVIDKIDDTMQAVMPNFNNSYMKQFTNQVRMGMASATNARIMSHALKSQNKIEEKIQARKDHLKDKFETQSRSIREKSINKGAMGKRLKNLESQYQREITELEKDGTRAYQLRQSAATEATAFSGGTGSIKQGHDGTIQNLKGGANADLTQAIYALLNGMGHSPDKTGVNKINPSGGGTA
ncbi:hypothetical protein PM10SUCC1_14850 [Propionigenium maris DSM 9537]|uniref:Uncharacterized protein n=1 Tax=Propionigenium maris DSM 9537 TaxID=1123000 RepID=A0A9W6GLK8_9FUSO|nr:hypothetical protein [Propionigenium maris]GLI55971.1 hypothetical protein PM10SUCC1_14850 [Propionigenium maris DSM 9537]